MVIYDIILSSSLLIDCDTIISNRLFELELDNNKNRLVDSFLLSDIANIDSEIGLIVQLTLYRVWLVFHL